MNHNKLICVSTAPAEFCPEKNVTCTCMCYRGLASCFLTKLSLQYLLAHADLTEATSERTKNLYDLDLHQGKNTHRNNLKLRITHSSKDSHVRLRHRLQHFCPAMIPEQMTNYRDRRGTQRQFSEKYLFGRRVEIQNFWNICCKISCLHASPKIFEQIKNGILAHF